MKSGGDDPERQTELSATVLSEIQKRLDAATSGPWKDYIEKRDGISGSDFIMTEGEDIYLIGGTAADYEFVAHARQDIPALLAEVRRLKRLLGQE